MVPEHPWSKRSGTSKTTVYSHIWYWQNQAQIHHWSGKKLSWCLRGKIEIAMVLRQRIHKSQNYSHKKILQISKLMILLMIFVSRVWNIFSKKGLNRRVKLNEICSTSHKLCHGLHFVVLCCYPKGLFHVINWLGLMTPYDDRDLGQHWLR